MSQPEARLKKKIMDSLKARGAFVVKVPGSPHMIVGMPDLVVCYRGRFLGLEIKLPRTRANATERQLFVISQIRRAEGLSGVICSVSEARDFIARVDGMIDDAQSSQSD